MDPLVNAALIPTILNAPPIETRAESPARLVGMLFKTNEPGTGEAANAVDEAAAEAVESQGPRSENIGRAVHNAVLDALIDEWNDRYPAFIDSRAAARFALSQDALITTATNFYLSMASAWYAEVRAPDADPTDLENIWWHGLVVEDNAVSAHLRAGGAMEKAAAHHGCGDPLAIRDLIGERGGKPIAESVGGDMFVEFRRICLADGPAWPASRG